MGQEAFGRPACTKRHLVPVCSERYPSQRPQRLIRTAGDAIVQDRSRPPARSERRLGTDGTSASAPARALGYSTSTFERPLIHRGSLAKEPDSAEPFFSQANFLFLFSSRGQIRVRSVKLFHTSSTKLSPLPQDMLVTLVAHLLISPSFRHAPPRNSPPVSWEDLVRADPRKAHDCHFLDMSSRMGGRSRIEGAVPASRFEEQHTTTEPVSVEQDFVGEESEPVGRRLRRWGAWAIGGRSP
ncbi:unnamed protein product [Ascophyllum nodosum]